MASPPTLIPLLPVHAPASIIGLVVSSTLALFSASVHAEDTTASSDIQSGIYSAGTCSDPEHLWLYASGISVVIDDDSVYGYIDTDSGPIAHGWRRFESKLSEGEIYAYFMRMLKDGGIEYVAWRPGPDNVAEPPEDRWASILPSGKEWSDEYWNLTTYMRCESIPFPRSMLHGEAAAFLFSLEPAIPVCRSGHLDCIQRIFAAADVHRDGALSQAEWARLIRVTIYFVMIFDVGISTDKLGSAQAVSLFISPLAASAIVSSYDYDGNGKTSLGELTREVAGQGALTIPEIGDAGADVRDDLDKVMTRLGNLLQLLPDLQ